MAAMLKKDPNYRRLKLGGAGLLGVSTLWLARDHLLVVEVSGYVEKYRRFYFRDIQAVIVQNTNVRLGWTIGLAVCLALSLLGLVSVKWDSSSPNPVLLGVCVAFMLGFGVPLMINLLRGPTCTVLLRTAVQTQKIPGLSRRAKAGKLVETLAPAITAAQQASPAPAAAPIENPSGFAPG